MFQIGRVVWTLLSIFILAAAGSIAESFAGDDADKVKGYSIVLYVIGGFLLVYNVFFIIFSSLLFHGAPGAPKTSPKTKKCTPIKPAAASKTTSAKVVPVSSAATNKAGPPTSAVRNLQTKTQKTGLSQLFKKVPINKPEPTLPKSRVC